MILKEFKVLAVLVIYALGLMAYTADNSADDDQGGASTGSVTSGEPQGTAFERTPSNNGKRKLRENPLCPSDLKIEISSENKRFSSLDPASTDVAREAKSQGLMPVMVMTMFARPSSNMNKEIPANITALTTSLLHSGVFKSKEGTVFPFLSGKLTDSFQDSLDQSNKGFDDANQQQDGGSKGNGQKKQPPAAAASPAASPAAGDSAAGESEQQPDSGEDESQPALRSKRQSSLSRRPKTSRLY